MFLIKKRLETWWTVRKASELWRGGLVHLVLESWEQPVVVLDEIQGHGRIFCTLSSAKTGFFFVLSTSGLVCPLHIVEPSVKTFWKGEGRRNVFHITLLAWRDWIKPRILMQSPHHCRKSCLNWTLSASRQLRWLAAIFKDYSKVYPFHFIPVSIVRNISFTWDSFIDSVGKLWRCNSDENIGTTWRLNNYCPSGLARAETNCTPREWLTHSLIHSLTDSHTHSHTHSTHTLSLTHSQTHSLTHTHSILSHTLTHSLNTLTQSLTRTDTLTQHSHNLAHSLTNLLTHSTLSHSLTHSLNTFSISHSPAHSLTQHSLTQSLTHSLNTHWLSHSLTHKLTHTLTNSLTYLHTH